MHLNKGLTNVFSSMTKELKSNWLRCVDRCVRVRFACLTDAEAALLVAGLARSS